MSSMTRDKSQAFDSNSITTGSEFMNNLSRYVHINIGRQLLHNPEWKDLEVIFSNEKVPGEGEHKIINYMKLNASMSFCVDSPDADLLMLTLSLPNPKIYIIRENIYKSIDCKYFVVDVNTFRTIIIDKFRWGSAEHTYTDTGLIHDFIFICFLLGNDFLPHIPSLEISNKGLDVLMETYPRIATNHGHLVYRSKKTGELSLNTKALSQLFFSLAGGEKERMTEKSLDKSLDFPDTLLASCKEGNKGDIDFNKYRTLYYEKKLHDTRPSDVCHEYFKGMLFVIRYYIDGIPDWHYSYPFHKAPFFMDMYESILDFDGEMKFEQNEPLLSFEQLLAVMPPGSIDILPPALRSLLLDRDSPIADFYPESFVVDLDGKKKEWEGQAIIPFIDVGRLKAAYESKKSLLSEEERRRNQPGKTMRYFKCNDTVITKYF
jgi:5'-3' exonuclease